MSIFRPRIEGSERRLPVIFWIHGGGFLAGDKSHLSNYLQILAAKGYAVVGINYTLAPAARYPKPTLEANAALAFIKANAAKLNIDSERIILAGNSAGAQIAAQLAIAISDPAYARALEIAPAIERPALRGISLYCGIYDPDSVKAEGPMAGFLKAVGWSYFDTKALDGTTLPKQFSICAMSARICRRSSYPRAMPIRYCRIQKPWRNRPKSRRQRRYAVLPKRLQAAAPARVSIRSGQRCRQIGAGALARLHCPANSVATAVLLGEAILAVRQRHAGEIDIGIDHLIARRAIANHEKHNVAIGLVEEAVCIAGTGRKADTGAGLHRLLAGVGLERRFAFEDIDELVLARMRMPAGRLPARHDARHGDAEIA